MQDCFFSGGAFCGQWMFFKFGFLRRILFSHGSGSVGIFSFQPKRIAAARRIKLEVGLGPTFPAIVTSTIND